MNRWTGQPGRIVSAIVFALLIGMQTMSVAHAFEHDPGTIGDKACATCISINQLSAATVDTGHIDPPAILKPIPVDHVEESGTSRTICVPRQRGPPATP